MAVQFHNGNGYDIGRTAENPQDKSVGKSVGPGDRISSVVPGYPKVPLRVDTGNCSPFRKDLSRHSTASSVDGPLYRYRPIERVFPLPGFRRTHRIHTAE